MIFLDCYAVAHQELFLPTAVLRKVNNSDNEIISYFMLMTIIMSVVVLVVVINRYSCRVRRDIWELPALGRAE